MTASIKVTMVVVLISLTAFVSSGFSQGMESIESSSRSSFNQVTNSNRLHEVDLGSIVNQPRAANVAVIPGNENNFSVVYLTSGTNGWFGDLYVRNFNVQTGYQSEPKLISDKYVSWVRSSMSLPLFVSNECMVVLGERNSSAVTQRSVFDYAMPGYINFTVFDEDSERVKLLRTRSCSSSSVTHDVIDIGEGHTPSVAIGRDDVGNPLIFVTYGHINKILGRFFNDQGIALGTAFVIQDPISTDGETWGAFSTDVIWNHRSNRFIVGTMLKSNMPYDDPGCIIYNMSVFSDGGITVPIERGECHQARGHHTWVDIDKRPDSNQEGEYAWWYQSFAGKAVSIMDRFGNPTSRYVRWNDGSVGTTAWTTSFAAVNKKKTVVINGQTLPVSEISPDYTSGARHTAINDVYAVHSFNTDGILMRGKELPLQGNHPLAFRTVAAGSLSRYSVYVTILDRFDHTHSTSRAFLSVKDTSIPVGREDVEP